MTSYERRLHELTVDERKQIDEEIKEKSWGVESFREKRIIRIQTIHPYFCKDCSKECRGKETQFLKIVK
jgi:hypothetical protein